MMNNKEIGQIYHNKLAQFQLVHSWITECVTQDSFKLRKSISPIRP